MNKSLQPTPTETHSLERYEFVRQYAYQNYPAKAKISAHIETYERSISKAANFCRDAVAAILSVELRREIKPGEAAIVDYAYFPESGILVLDYELELKPEYFVKAWDARINDCVIARYPANELNKAKRHARSLGANTKDYSPIYKTQPPIAFVSDEWGGCVYNPRFAKI